MNGGRNPKRLRPPFISYGFLALDASFVVHHFYGRYGTFVAFVSQNASCAVLSLLQIVASEQTVDDRHVASRVQFS